MYCQILSVLIIFGVECVIIYFNYKISENLVMIVGKPRLSHREPCLPTKGSLYWPQWLQFSVSIRVGHQKMVLNIIRSVRIAVNSVNSEAGRVFGKDRRL